MENVILENSSFSKIKYFDDEASLNSMSVEKCSTILLSKCSPRLAGSQQGICIMLPRGAQYVVAIMAAWRAGFYVVPLNENWPTKKNLDIVERIRPAAILVQDGVTLETNHLVLPASAIFQKLDSIVTNRLEENLCTITASDIAYVIFTSGSTGEPKGVVITAGAFRAYIDWTQRFFNEYKDCKRLLLTSELTFDITMGDIAFALAFGTDIGVATHNTNIPSVLAMIMRHQIDVLYSVPTTHLGLVNFAKAKKGANLNSLRLILSGGDRFPWQLVKDYVDLTSGASFFNVYGPTEFTINCFAVRLDDKLNLSEQGKPVPIGHCFDTLDYVLLDDQDKPADVGELCVTGPQAMLGYHGDHKLSSLAFISVSNTRTSDANYYRTGDIGYIDGGLMYLKGRIDGLVKVRGYRIHPDEIAKAIDTILGVDASAVINYGGQSDAAFAAFIKLKSGYMLSERDISEALKSKIPDYMIPSRYEFIDIFPHNQSQKIDKKVMAGKLKWD